jgi:alanyl-tRNA synthetase
MTEKLYYQNQYQSEFKAVVTKIEHIEQGWALTLNRTQFYPEGGGQPSDRGWINDTPLLDVKKAGDEVVHILPPASQFSEGETVMARVDWSHRFDYMQQHTAQHIISAVLHRSFGIGTVAVHRGEELLTI